MKNVNKNMDAKKIYERIKAVTGATTQMKIADILDIRQSSISDAMRRNVIPDSWVVRLFNIYGINPDWLLHATGPCYLRKNGEYGAFAADGNRDETSLGGLSIPCLLPVENAEEGGIVVPSGFLTSGSGKKYVAFRVSDRSMEPVFPIGTYCGIGLLPVDASSLPLVDGGFYTLKMPNQIILRRCSFSMEKEGEFLFHTLEETSSSLSFNKDTLKDIYHGQVEFFIGRIGG